MDDLIVKDNSSPSKYSGAPRSVADLKAAREARAAESLRLKDDQLRILTEQNTKLIESLDKAEEETSMTQMEKIVVEDENRELRKSNFEAQTRARAAEGQLEKIISESSERDKQLELMTEQNGKLLRALEAEETSNERMASENESFEVELNEIRNSYNVILKTSKQHEESASYAVREEKLRTEEVKLLKNEIEIIRAQYADLKMKTSIEMDSLQEQLRVRKEKQYQLMEKLQIQEDSRRVAEDAVGGLEERIKVLERCVSETETQLQVEIQSKAKKDSMNAKLISDNKKVHNENIGLKNDCHKIEEERLRLESEARDSSEQLREMAEKVFQLLERLKLAELGKTRSVEALRLKDQETLSLKKKLGNAIKDLEKENKLRIKADLDAKALEDQIRALKKSNSHLGLRCKEEAKMKLKEEQDRKLAQEKVATLSNRMNLLLSKLQSDEEVKSIQKEERKKMEDEIKSWSSKCEELRCKSDLTEQKLIELHQSVEEKDDKLEEVTTRMEALQRTVDEYEEEQRKQDDRSRHSGNETASVSGKDEDNLAGGRLRFFVDKQSVQGVYILKAKKAKDRDWLEVKGCNTFLKRAMRSTNCKDLLIQKLAELYGKALSDEETMVDTRHNLKLKIEEAESLVKKTSTLYSSLGINEESKRKVLIKYINAVKACVSLGEPDSDKYRNEVGSVGAGRILLPDAQITDEEAHVVTSSLRDNVSITEVNFRGNLITDDGARAIAAALSSNTALALVDLRRNRIGRTGLRAIADALERSSRVNHVYVHSGGKVEAIGTDNSNRDDSNDVEGRPNPSATTICIVDLRDNEENRFCGLQEFPGNADNDNTMNTHANKDKRKIGNKLAQERDQRRRARKLKHEVTDQEHNFKERRRKQEEI